jgi:hypothetical protein
MSDDSDAYETSVNIYQTTQSYNSEDSHVYIRHDSQVA